MQTQTNTAHKLKRLFGRGGVGKGRGRGCGVTEKEKDKPYKVPFFPPSRSSISPSQPALRAPRAVRAQTALRALPRCSAAPQRLGQRRGTQLPRGPPEPGRGPRTVCLPPRSTARAHALWGSTRGHRPAAGIPAKPPRAKPGVGEDYSGGPALMPGTHLLRRKATGEAQGNATRIVLRSGSRALCPVWHRHVGHSPHDGIKPGAAPRALGQPVRAELFHCPPLLPSCRGRRR